MRSFRVLTWTEYTSVTKVAVFIDGGHLRACARSAKKPYTPDLVIKIAKSCVQTGETLFRILYYNCEEFAGSVKLPVSGGVKSYPGGNPFLSNLAREELVAVRRGILKFGGWERRAVEDENARRKPAWQLRPSWFVRDGGLARAPGAVEADALMQQGYHCCEVVLRAGQAPG